VAMWIGTQNLPNSFSLDNKTQKAVLPGTAPWATVLAETTFRSQLTNRQWRSNHERFTRLPGISGKWRIMAVYTKGSHESLTIWGQAEGVVSRPSQRSVAPGGSRFCPPNNRTVPQG
jgi:hypothetical protein